MTRLTATSAFISSSPGSGSTQERPPRCGIVHVTGVMARACSAAPPWRLTAAPGASYLSPDAAAYDPVPGDRSGCDLDRAHCHPLVCSRLYRRVAGGLALLPDTRRPPSASGRPPGRG